MKQKLLLIASLFLSTSMAQAQYQVPNNDFEESWVNCYPWEKGAPASSARGTTPTSWCVSNVPNSMMPVVAKQVDGENGQGVKLSNVAVMGQSAPGYITLGTTWATAETKGTTVRNPDGGVFGGISFTAHPDAVQLKYKRDISKGAERASLVAYLWKGSWTQADVPSNTAVGVFSYGTATKVTMTNRDRNILGKETDLGGTVTPTDDALLIASLEDYISAAADEWTTWTAEFDYKNNEAPEMLNIVVSATDYFAGKDAVVAENSITIDNVKLLYYHDLATATFNGEDITFTNNKATITSAPYNAALLELTSNGRGATIESSYDEASMVLTITVKGENYSEDNESVSTYTVEFVPPTITYEDKLMVTVNGESGDPQDASIDKIGWDGYPQTLSLTNFMFQGMPIGNVTLPNVTINQDGTFTTKQNITITAGNLNGYSESDWFGPFLGEIPVEMSGKIVGSKFETVINIDMTSSLGQVIVVEFGHDLIYNYSREVTVGNWGTLCLHFDYAAANLFGATFYSIAGKKTINEKPAYLVLKEETNLEAGMPYLFQATADKLTAIDGTDFAGQANAANGLTGSFAAMDVAAGNYLLSNNQIVLAGESCKLAADRAYINMSAVPEVSDEVKGIRFYLNSSADGIDAAKALEGDVKVFDLAGRRVNNAQKGIYIVNGKKVVK